MHDADAPKLGEAVDQAVGEPVAQILEVGVGAPVLERQDSERVDGPVRPGLQGEPGGQAQKSDHQRRAEQATHEPPPSYRRRCPAAPRLDGAPRALQVRAKVGRGLIAQLGVLLQRPGDDTVHLRGQVRVHAARRRRAAIEDPLEDDRRRIARECRVSGRHLVEHDAEREQVGSRVERLSTRLLGRHVGDRPDRRAGRRERLVRDLGRPKRGFGDLAGLVASLDRLGEAEVQDLGLPALRHEYVGGLDVPVHDSLGVCGLQRVGDLHREPQKLAGGQGPPVDVLLQRLAFQQLGRDEEPAVDLVDVVDGADVRVVQCRGRPRLAPEAFEGVAVSGKILGEELQRHVPAESRVLGAVDDAHATASDLLHDAVVGESSANLHGRPPALSAHTSRACLRITRESRCRSSQQGLFAAQGRFLPPK